MQAIRRGDRGLAVADVRAALVALGLLRNAEPRPTDLADAVYDRTCELAVREFQQNRGLLVDGTVGQETYRALTEARWRLGDRLLHYAPTHMLRGDDVSALQERLLELGYNSGRVDGIFGPLTDSALRGFQRDYGLVADATCGPATLRALRQLGRKVVGGAPHRLREEAWVARSGPQLIGKKVVLDPGHGGEDPGLRYAGLTESDLTWDLAARIEGRLAVAGVTAYFTRGPQTGATNAKRAGFANATDADLLVSLHLDGHPSPQAQGLATYYFGAGSGVSSHVGEAFAGLVHREILARTGLVDCAVHPKTWELLRLTRMPAVRLDVGYLTHHGDRARLADPAFRDAVAEAVLASVQRFFLPAEDDFATGTWTLPADLRV